MAAGPDCLLLPPPAEDTSYQGFELDAGLRGDDPGRSLESSSGSTTSSASSLGGAAGFGDGSPSSVGNLNIGHGKPTTALRHSFSNPTLQGFGRHSDDLGLDGSHFGPHQSLRPTASGLHKSNSAVYGSRSHGSHYTDMSTIHPELSSNNSYSRSSAASGSHPSILEASFSNLNMDGDISHGGGSHIGVNSSTSLNGLRSKTGHQGSFDANPLMIHVPDASPSQSAARGLGTSGPYPAGFTTAPNPNVMFPAYTSPPPLNDYMRPFGQCSVPPRQFDSFAPPTSPLDGYATYGMPGMVRTVAGLPFTARSPAHAVDARRGRIPSSSFDLYSPSSSSSGLFSIDGSSFSSPSPSPRSGGGFGAFDLETRRCSNAIKKLCSAGNVTEVFVVLEEMLARGLIPDIKTIKTIMRVCVKKLCWRRAVQLLHYGALPLDVVIYTMAINTCGKAGEWEQGLRVLREMNSDEARMRGIAPNEVSYGTAISACGKAGRWEIALTLLNEVKDRGLMLNDVCYGGAIDACGRAGQWQEALKLLHEMMLEGVPANEVCYNSAISACGKAGEWEKAVSLLREMRDRGLTPDELNYNSAISACGKAAQWAHAIRLLREMAVQGLTPDVVSYGAAIDACRKAGKYDRGLALLREMKDVGLIPNEVCYHSAVTACSEAGRWSEALFVLSEMVKQGLKPDAISYNAAVEACAKSGKWEALVVLLQETGRDPDATLIEAVFNNAVMSCSKYGNWELAATVLQEMEYRDENGPGSTALSPTSASYSAVIEACAKALSQGQAKGTQRQWDLILAKLDCMRKKGLLPDSASYNAAVRACVSGPEVKYWKKAVTLLQEMAARAYIVDQATSTALITACSGTGCSCGLSSSPTGREETLMTLRELLGGRDSTAATANVFGTSMEPDQTGQWAKTLKILSYMAQVDEPMAPGKQLHEASNQQRPSLTIAVPNNNDCLATAYSRPTLGAVSTPVGSLAHSTSGSPLGFADGMPLPSPPHSTSSLSGSHGPIGSPTPCVNRTRSRGSEDNASPSGSPQLILPANSGLAKPCPPTAVPASSPTTTQESPLSSEGEGSKDESVKTDGSFFLHFDMEWLKGNGRNQTTSASS